MFLPGSVLTTLQRPRSPRSFEHPVSWVSAVAAVALLGGGLCGTVLGSAIGIGAPEQMQMVGILGGLLTAFCLRVVTDMRPAIRFALRRKSDANVPLPS
jgi:hypothetical protein